MYENRQEKKSNNSEAIYRGDLVWLTYGATSIICLVLEVHGTPYHQNPVRNWKYLVWGDGKEISIQGWHLTKIQSGKK